MKHLGAPGGSAIDMIKCARTGTNEFDGEAYFLGISTATDMMHREGVPQEAHEYAHAIRADFEKAFGYDDAEGVAPATLLEQAEKSAFRIRDAQAQPRPGGP
jgi:hypothetical protein